MKLYEFKNEKTNQTIYFQDFLNTGTKPYFNYLNNNIKSFLENNNTRRYIYVHCRNIQNQRFLFWKNS